MLLTKSKKEFAISKIIGMINSSTDYSLSDLSYNKSFKFPVPRTQNSTYSSYVEISFSKTDEKSQFKSVTFEQNQNIIKIDYDKSIDNKITDLINTMNDKIIQIDERKFKAVFPDWDEVESRDSKLKEILGESEVVQKKKWFR